MNISVIGCGRWGSCIGWYLSTIGHDILLYGRENSKTYQSLLKNRKNEHLTLTDNMELSCEIKKVCQHSDIIIISISAQNLRALMEELSTIGIDDKTLVLCMKGIEENSGKRLSEICKEYTKAKIAIWVGPGHVQEFVANKPNCMLIDSDDSEVTHRLIEEFSGKNIRFYYGTNLIGNEIGAATKNVIGIASGILDGMDMSSLKGVLISRATKEVSRLIDKMGGDKLCAYGLAHLGDYGATVFSQYSHNRAFGENLAKGKKFDKLAEGVYTTKALMLLCEKYQVEMPICKCIYSAIFEEKDIEVLLGDLFKRPQKTEE